MNKWYLVKIKVFIPFFFTLEERVEASNPVIAIRKAYKVARRERLKGKRLKEWVFEVVQL